MQNITTELLYTNDCSQVFLASACIEKKHAELYNVIFCICASSQKQFTVALLDRYRKALETAVQLSCRYNVPPLPGRTIIALSSNLRADEDWCKKQDFCLPPDPEQKNDEEDEEEEESGRRRKKKKQEDKLTPSVRACFLLIGNNTKED